MSTLNTAEQQELRAATRDLFTARAAREAQRAYIDDSAPFDTELWKLMATELGLHGIMIDEAYGGGGGTFVDLMVVLEEAGAALLCNPFFSTVVLAATAIESSGDDEVKTQILPAIASGDIVAALAHRSPAGSHPPQARQTGGGWTLTGVTTHVIDGAAADAVLVVAETDAGQGVFLVDAGADGLMSEELPSLDPTRRLARLDFAETPARLVGSDGAGASILDRTLRIARIALCAEQVGGITRCLEMSVDYVKTRHQFGRAIGSFQAVKHHVANMFVALETARASTLHSAALADDFAPQEAIERATSALVSDAFYRAATLSIQLHGGIGYTWEHDAHLYLKRALSSARIFDTPANHREIVASALGL